MRFVIDTNLLVSDLMPPCAPSEPSEPSIIEIEIYGARVRLHGQAGAQRPGIALDAWAQRV